MSANCVFDTSIRQNGVIRQANIAFARTAGSALNWSSTNSLKESSDKYELNLQNVFT